MHLVEHSTGDRDTTTTHHDHDHDHDHDHSLTHSLSHAHNYLCYGVPHPQQTNNRIDHLSIASGRHSPLSFSSKTNQRQRDNTSHSMYMYVVWTEPESNLNELTKLQNYSAATLTTPGPESKNMKRQPTSTYIT